MPDTPVTKIITARKGCVSGGVSGAQLESLETRVNDAVDEGINAKKASGTAGGYAATEEGGYRIHGQFSVTHGAGVTVDSSRDWRERRVMVRWQAYNAAAKLPGGGSEDQNAPDYPVAGYPQMDMWFTSAGSANVPPPGTPRRVLLGTNLFLWVDSADHALKLWNNDGALDYYVEIWIEATGKLF